jgi:CheY-specific phosphatase CheX
MGEETPEQARWIAEILPVARGWTDWYLQHELGIKAGVGRVHCDGVHRISLRDFTAMVGIGGHVNALVAVSFDAALMEHVAKTLTDGLDVSDMETEELQSDAAGEVVNTIAGNCTADLYEGGKALSLTPPVTLGKTSSFSRHKGAACCTLTFSTGNGALDLIVIGAGPSVDMSK